MTKRKELGWQRTHKDLIGLIKRIYPKKSMPEATKMLSLDIYNGTNLLRKLKKNEKNK